MNGKVASFLGQFFIDLIYFLEMHLSLLALPPLEQSQKEKSHLAKKETNEK